MKNKLIITIIIIVSILLLLYLYNNKIINKKIVENENINKEKFFADPKEFCPQLRENIFFKAFKPKEDSYFCMIPNNQPFNYYDSIKMIVETKNYLFVLNESMTRIHKADKKIGNFIDITQDLYDGLKAINVDTMTYVFPIIGADYETDECFVYVKKYDKALWETKKNNDGEKVDFVGELWKVEGKPKESMFTKIQLIYGGDSINIDFIGKLHIESKMDTEGTYYNIYAIQRVLEENTTHIYKCYLVNFFGNKLDNDFNYYYGKKGEFNSRIIGEFEIDKEKVVSLETDLFYYNDSILNIFTLNDNYRQIENAIINKNYKFIFKFVQNDIFTTYLSPSDVKQFGIKTNEEFYTNIILKQTYKNYAQTDNRIKFAERLDTIKKMNCIEFGKECLKILNQYRDILVNEGLNIGVQDFNVNDDRILILFNNITSYSNNNLSLEMKHIRLNTRFVKELIKYKDTQGNYKIELLKASVPIPVFNNEMNLKVNGDIQKTYTIDKTDKYKDIWYIKNIEDINDNKILENGNIFIKYNNEDLNITKRNGEPSNNNKDKDLYNEKLNSNIGNFLDLKTSLKTSNLVAPNETFQYLFTFPDKEKPDYKNYFKIKKGSLVGKQNIYGILEYDDSKISDDSKTSKEIKLKDKESIFHKRSVFFTLYAKPEEPEYEDKIGPLYLALEIEHDYIFNPSIKFEHEGMSLYNWFMTKEKEGKFKNRRDWYEMYDMMKTEGIYYPNPKAGYNIQNRNFVNIMRDLKNSIEEDTYIIKNRLFTNRHLKNLLSIEDANVYDTKYDDFHPQLYIYKELGMDKEECYIYVNFKPDNVIDNILEKNREANMETEKEFLGVEKEPDTITSKVISLRNKKFKKKYSLKDDNLEYQYHILIKKKEEEIKQFNSNEEKVNYVWSKMEINNFTEYLNLITGGIQLKDNSRDRIRGLYEIDTKFMDEEYYNYLLKKKEDNPYLKELDGIIEIALQNLNNYEMAHGYPFWVIYKTVDYNGNPCREGAKNSQKLFLTSKILDSHIIHEDKDNIEYSDLEQYPFIKEEFMSFTGHGNDIQFYGKKIGGSTQIAPKKFCNYEPLPIEECTSDTCFPKTLGLVRMDGSPKCQIQDDTVKQKTETPNFVEIIGNVNTNACDLYKLKGNKQLFYRLGRVFKYGRDGKYQLKNIYTIQQMYDGKYFYHMDDNITLKNKLVSSNINNYAFTGETKEDIYGMYYLFKPMNGDKYLTRKINVFDREFEDWSLDDFKDITKKQRNKEDTETRLHLNDPDYYSQKFAIPEELILNIAVQDGISSPSTDLKLNELRKQESVRCKTSPELCDGDLSYEAPISPLEEKKLLNKQLDDIRSMMGKLNQIPNSFFDKPDLTQLAKKIKQLKTVIPEMETKVVETIKANEFLLTLDENLKQEQNQILLEKQEKNNLLDNTNNTTRNNTNNTTRNNKAKNKGNNKINNKDTVFAQALESIKDTFKEERQKNNQSKCYNMEQFSNPNIYSRQPNNSTDLNKHISDEYSNYIGGKMGSTQEKVAEMQKIVGQNLDKISSLSNSIKLDGNTKQLLMSDKINEENNLDKDIFKIKNSDQQSRVSNILKKLEEIEKIRSEMNEDDFKTKKHENEAQYKTLISREDGETMNMYQIKENEIPKEMIFSPSDSNHNLLFINGGCLSYDDKELDINSKHCMVGDPKQMFQMHRVEDIEDMKKYNIKNQDKGMDRAYSIIMANDKKCLHKENNELSFRRCDNTVNQYWDYSDITGPNV